MKRTKITYQNIRFFSKTVKDYLNQKESITPFYDLDPTLENFKKQIELKSLSVRAKSRTNLTNSLKKQYQNTKTSNSVLENIESLALENTFTITTGHQLNLFTGPLYFLYKIISTINLTEKLKKEHPQHNFVPIYWMATEDHDFDEINFFNTKKTKLQWQKDSTTAVGRLDTKGLDKVYQELKNTLGLGDNARTLVELFKDSYLEHDNLTNATRHLANQLFQEYGLVILDADDVLLKQEFIPFITDELQNQTSFKQVSKTIESFKTEYKVQVNPREVNLFYLTDEYRERIIFENGTYKVNNQSIQFTEKEILAEVTNFPERFSPNVIMRPLYQEVILPNLCYIGGGGELAYWLELKDYFETVNIPFPILLLRNSGLILSPKQEQKLDRLDILVDDLFLNQTDLIKNITKENSRLNLDFSEQKTFLQKQFEQLKEIAKLTDKSFIGAVNAQEKKQLNGLDNLEKRLLKAEKRKYNQLLERITSFQDELFPNQSLQERQTNFSELYLEYGTDLIPLLKENLDPLDATFTILSK